jgi:hypothetical protein
MRDRLEPTVFSFFSEADVHDGRLMEFRVVDGRRPDPVEHGEWIEDDPVTVLLRVTDSRETLQWMLKYEGVRKVLADYPGANDLFPVYGGGFGDWGYHELTNAGNGLLRHEILFASGSTLLVEFKRVHVECTTAR